MTPPIAASASDSTSTETTTERGVEAERPQRGDLARARGHRGVHRQDGAEHGADAHQRGDAEADALDEPAERLRLLRVVLGLAPHLHVELRVAGEPVAEGVEACRWSRGAPAPTGSELPRRYAPCSTRASHQISVSATPPSASKMPTTFQVFCPELMRLAHGRGRRTGRWRRGRRSPRWCRTAACGLRRSTPRRAPCSAAGSTPRIGTFAAVLVDFFGRSMMT